MGVSLAHQLVRLLGRGVERERMVDAVIDRERQLGVAAVDRARAGVDHVAHAAVAGDLKHVEMADQVGLDVGVRVFDRVTHARLGAEVDDAVELVLPEGLGQPGGVGEILLQEGEAIAAAIDQPVTTVLLQRDRVIVIEIVDPDDAVAPFEEL